MIQNFCKHLFYFSHLYNKSRCCAHKHAHKIAHNYVISKVISKAIDQIRNKRSNHPSECFGACFDLRALLTTIRQPRGSTSLFILVLGLLFFTWATSQPTLLASQHTSSLLANTATTPAAARQLITRGGISSALSARASSAGATLRRTQGISALYHRRVSLWRPSSSPHLWLIATAVAGMGLGAWRAWTRQTWNKYTPAGSLREFGPMQSRPQHTRPQTRGQKSLATTMLASLGSSGHRRIEDEDPDWLELCDDQPSIVDQLDLSASYQRPRWDLTATHKLSELRSATSEPLKDVLIRLQAYRQDLRAQNSYQEHQASALMALPQNLLASGLGSTFNPWASASSPSSASSGQSQELSPPQTLPQALDQTSQSHRSTIFHQIHNFGHTTPITIEQYLYFLCHALESILTNTRSIAELHKTVPTSSTHYPYFNQLSDILNTPLIGPRSGHRSDNPKAHITTHSTSFSDLGTQIYALVHSLKSFHQSNSVRYHLDLPVISTGTQSLSRVIDYLIKDLNELSHGFFQIKTILDAYSFKSPIRAGLTQKGMIEIHLTKSDVVDEDSPSTNTEIFSQLYEHLDSARQSLRFPDWIIHDPTLEAYSNTSERLATAASILYRSIKAFRLEILPNHHNPNVARQLDVDRQLSPQQLKLLRPYMDIMPSLNIISHYVSSLGNTDKDVSFAARYKIWRDLSYAQKKWLVDGHHPHKDELSDHELQDLDLATTFFGISAQIMKLTKRHHREMNSPSYIRTSPGAESFRANDSHSANARRREAINARRREVSNAGRREAIDGLNYITQSLTTTEEELLATQPYLSAIITSRSHHPSLRRLNSQASTTARRPTHSSGVPDTQVSPSLLPHYLQVKLSHALQNVPRFPKYALENITFWTRAYPYAIKLGGQAQKIKAHMIHEGTYELSDHLLSGVTYTPENP